MSEISERGRKIVDDALRHGEYPALVEYVALLESAVSASRGFETEHELADDGPGNFERGLLRSALAALGLAEKEEDE